MAVNVLMYRCAVDAGIPSVLAISLVECSSQSVNAHNTISPWIRERASFLS